MNFISAIKAERLIAQIRGEASPSSVSARKAFEKLHKLGAAAIPKILLALAEADKQQTIEFVDVLTRLADDKALPALLDGLADANPKTVTATASALAASRRFNPNRLVDLLAEDKFSKSAIVDVLQAHQDRLSLNHLLAQVYDMQPSEKTAVFKMVREIATEEQVPDLLARINGKDPVVKANLIRAVAPFERPDVQQALESTLGDENKMVRTAALTALSQLNGAGNVDIICSLLCDSDVDRRDRKDEPSGHDGPSYSGA